MDVFWPVPFLWWSALPTSFITRALVARFDAAPERRDPGGRHWLTGTMSVVVVVDSVHLQLSDGDNPQATARATRPARR
jgi:hypothetical protein